MTKPEYQVKSKKFSSNFVKKASERVNIQPQSSKKVERPVIETKLLTAIKKLNDHKDAYNAYLEADETVAMMSP